jgi:hypothetical protein
MRAGQQLGRRIERAKDIGARVRDISCIFQTLAPLPAAVEIATALNAAVVLSIESDPGNAPLLIGTRGRRPATDALAAFFDTWWNHPTLSDAAASRSHQHPRYGLEKIAAGQFDHRKACQAMFHRSACLQPSL